AAAPTTRVSGLLGKCCTGSPALPAARANRPKSSATRHLNIAPRPAKAATKSNTQLGYGVTARVRQRSDVSRPPNGLIPSPIHKDNVCARACRLYGAGGFYR